MSSFLDRVVAERRADARRRRGDGALDHVREQALAVAPPLDLAQTLRAPGLSVIAEVKRASPSAGAISGSADPASVARAYADAGAAAVSVLTEPTHFAGSLDDLRAVRDVVELPVLRKDFVCDPLMVWEARAAGADAVLLIVAALAQTELVALLDLVEQLGMTALVEVHEREEVARALDAGARVVGINTRNLLTLEVDRTAVARVRPLLPDSVVIVAESGIRNRDDMDAMALAGCDAVLVGETLMRAPDPGAALRALLRAGA